MSNVLVDPAALEEAAKWLEVHSSSSGSAEAFAAEALREAIAQPAEADGVETFSPGFTAPQSGHPNDVEAYMYEDDAGEWMTVAQHQRIVAAVTAERDRLLATAYDEAVEGDHNLVPSLQAERDQLRAEVEALRKDAERLDWLVGQENCVAQQAADGFWLQWIDEHDPGLSRYQSGSYPDARAALDAAMAAKEGSGEP